MSAGAAGREDAPRVAVVGLGLIGGSLARLLAARGVDVVATDVSAATRAAARRAGLTVADDVAGCVADAGLVVLATPLRAMPAVAADVAAHAPASATVTDVGSVKGPVRTEVRAAGLGDRYVGAHPMAGTEHSGFDASEASLLDGVRWAVTVDPAVDPARLATVLELVTGPCAGTVAVLTDEVHDEAAALVSHVPHVVATQLLNAVAGAPVRDVALGLAAGSFRDGTRVAFTDPARTEAMVTQNAAWVAPALRKVVRDLELVIEALETNASTHAFFRAADAVRQTGHPPVPAGAAPTAVEQVPLTAGWPAALVERCTAGAVVVGLTPTYAEVVPLAPR
ncbi:prephenate dehydrogenase [Isoptericola sp. CG 20/1183]|uniref:Prephenate dehydrogenase n=1 Tax=Isoptericola halotolerans TaxID=300560 RepID=A0ABX5EF26_9MICO|nr:MULTISPECIES: prephenate dehydrogenase/arogenate dehydrogenase family protein [Isoptericola]PRZ07752.1 prephenate dehydrogenase [Isoptericola halotolerans]PRZ07889.1 prephenate dehydrogenase [Isoptericola sp. CG 20/1183]